MISGLLTSSNKYVMPIKQFLNWFGNYTLELYIIHLLMYTFLHNDYFHVGLSASVNILLSILIAIVLCAPVHNLIDIALNNLDKSKN